VSELVHFCSDRYSPGGMNDGIGRARESAWRATISNKNG
jgi:hypothetical protein